MRWNKKRVAESPIPLEEASRHSETTYGHLAPAEKELLTIVFHGAVNLPSRKNGSKPLAFVIAKSTTQDEKHEESSAVSSTTWEPTKFPTWETTVKLEIETEAVGREDVILKVLDSRNSELLVSYPIPIKYLRPFHPYHFELVKIHKNGLARLYVSITRENSFMPRYIGCTHTALEVFLQGANELLANPFGPLMVVARVISNYREFKEKLNKEPLIMGLPMRTINFPNPSVMAFDVPLTNNQGYPQVSKPGWPAKQPEWNTSFLYQARNGCTQFNEDLALVLEYYPIISMPKKGPWNLMDPLGISVLPLSNRVYRKMISGPRMALHVKKLSIVKTKLKTIVGGTPTVGLYFQVHSSERPDNFLTPHNCMDIPVLNPIFLDTDLGTISESWCKGYALSENKQDLEPAAELDLLFMDNSFSGTSLEQAKEHSQETGEEVIRWPHQKSVYRLQSKSQSTEELPTEKTNEYSQQSPKMAHLTSSPNCLDLTAIQGHHSEGKKHKQSDASSQKKKEVNKYQKAVMKMANDILSLRSQVTSLETENNCLRQQVFTQKTTSQASPEEEVIVNMKQKLSQSTKEMRKLKDRVQQLQNELIKKNDVEKDLLLIQKSHQQQQQHLKKYQDKLQKMEGLERTVKNQEKMIQTMETILEEKANQPSKERFNALVSLLDQPQGKTMGEETDKEKYNDLLKITGPMRGRVPYDFYSVLLAENARLRSELDKTCHQSVPIILKQQALPDLRPAVPDKLNLIVKLDSAQNRVWILETEVAGRIMSSLGPGKAALNLETYNSRPWLYNWIQSYINKEPSEKSDYGMKMACLGSPNKGILRSIQLSKSRKNRIRCHFIQNMNCKYHRR